MKNVIAKIQEQFGVEELPHGLFHSFDQALRFELGGEKLGTDRPMRRFTQAHDRSNAVSKAFIDNSPEVFVLLSSYEMEQPDKKRLKPLKLCGIKRSEFQYLSKTRQQDDDHIAEFGSDIFRHWDMAKLKDKETISEILWLGIASEMGIKPTFHGSMTAYFVDPENGLVLHLYDDRGMDVVATQKAPLNNLFARYNDWLLDYDLTRMTDMFGGE
ncbi:DUF3885 domain-containing protein [Ruegeria meonggei]|uniref:DUF3885 domain-containing protein n=1 Tax=Ruegeria meonggei TaxID=1446476 RepID=A0A1X6ZP23_9RHOB|nr:DUF3885 domain-containing protein [Ruegeria meonggei]SLN56872.1 hypothetical protein RUM8411_02775 [Ruegeria meonggei]